MQHVGQASGVAEIALAVGVSEATVKRDWLEVKKVCGEAIRT